MTAAPRFPQGSIHALVFKAADECNGTQVQCLAFIGLHNEVDFSNIATLTVQSESLMIFG